MAVLNETPLKNRFASFPAVADFFNWTMGYRADSDVPWPFGAVVPRDPAAVNLSTEYDPGRFGAPDGVGEILAGKTRLAAWFVSNCDSDSDREAYAAGLAAAGAPVTVLGGCSPAEGGRGCPRDSDCEREAWRSHKFYLAFENAVCADYATEKFFGALSRGAVPVVLGGADYRALAPDRSYVDAAAFASPAALAAFLLELDADDERYRSYFWWKDHFDVVGGHDTVWHFFYPKNIFEF